MPGRLRRVDRTRRSPIHRRAAGTAAPPPAAVSDLVRTPKGWVEPAPKRCANGDELRGGTCLVGTQHCDCMSNPPHAYVPALWPHHLHAAAGIGVPTPRVR